MATISLLAASALVLSGCSSEASGGGSDSGGPVELTMMNHSRGQEAALQQLVATYAEETGVTVTLDTPGPADYVSKLQSKAQSGSMPDVFTAVGPADMAPYYKAGWALDLSSELESGWKDEFTPAVVEISAWEDGNALDVPAGTYAAYWEIATYGVFVNPDTSGIDPEAPPTTIGEMTDLLSESAGGGNGLFSVAGSLAPTFVQSYASNWLSDEEINDTLGGDASWESDGWRNTFEIFTDLRDAGVIANNALPTGSDDNTAVEKSFFNVKDTAAIFDGSWATGVATATAPDFTSYRTMSLPAADDGDLAPRAPAIAGRGAAVNAKGNHVEESLAFVRWLTEKDQQKVLMDTAGLIPTNVELLESGEAPDQVAGFVDTIGDVQVIQNQFTADVVDAINRGSQSLVLGEKTVDEVLEEVQSAQDRSA
ncbi:MULTISPECIES: ABC transporter substrate-binding protein [Rathayibacter]|uniref:ABC transporter substrate-binding protein n=1 Tax=Rathayibacter TaxID=33886 RepID=UPI0013596F68|nr:MULTISPECIES: ABC transporter substrate-binding protein [Rathayibacter]